MDKGNANQKRKAQNMKPYKWRKGDVEAHKPAVMPSRRVKRGPDRTTLARMMLREAATAAPWLASQAREMGLEPDGTDVHSLLSMRKIKKGIVEGDIKAIDSVLDEVFGKVPDKVETQATFSVAPPPPPEEESEDEEDAT